MKIEFQNPVDYTVTEPKVVSLSEITVTRMIDLPEDKKVIVLTREAGQHILWEGDEYDRIGQWTDQNVIDRLTQIISG